MVSINAERAVMDLMPDPSELLQAEVHVSLASWYASPLTLAAAHTLQTQARQQIQRALAEGRGDVSARIADMIAGYWLGRRVALDFRSLVATAPEPQQAIVELIYGQLLMSRKQTGALQHLERGFELATPVLAPAAYFILLRRHTLLRNLVLSAAGCPPQNLPDLLLEARIIQRLQTGAGRARNLQNPHEDTLG